mmetsp:Transcript_93780/g.286949  ORF Transcript_93780/g.286949 Transcript_93780/m.286949 type:complete len:346 (-) Transcript_93780:939-1976(-)
MHESLFLGGRRSCSSKPSSASAAWMAVLSVSASAPSNAICKSSPIMSACVDSSKVFNFFFAESRGSLSTRASRAARMHLARATGSFSQVASNNFKSTNRSSADEIKPSSTPALLAVSRATNNSFTLVSLMASINSNCTSLNFGPFKTACSKSAASAALTAFWRRKVSSASAAASSSSWANRCSSRRPAASRASFRTPASLAAVMASCITSTSSCAMAARNSSSARTRVAAATRSASTPIPSAASMAWRNSSVSSPAQASSIRNSASLVMAIATASSSTPTPSASAMASSSAARSCASTAAAIFISAMRMRALAMDSSSTPADTHTSSVRTSSGKSVPAIASNNSA